MKTLIVELICSEPDVDGHVYAHIPLTEELMNVLDQANQVVNERFSVHVPAAAYINRHVDYSVDGYEIADQDVEPDDTVTLVLDTDSTRVEFVDVYEVIDHEYLDDYYSDFLPTWSELKEMM
jgi:hypothetical protein